MLTVQSHLRQVLDITDPSAIKLRWVHVCEDGMCPVLQLHGVASERHNRLLQPRTAASCMCRIHEDPYTEKEKLSHYMWFYFRITGVRGTPLTMRLENAGVNHEWLEPKLQLACACIAHVKDVNDWIAHGAGSASFPEAWPGYKVSSWC